MTFTSVVNKSQAELDKLYDWLDNPEQNTVGRKSGKIYKPLSYQEQYFGYEDNEPEVEIRSIPKPNKPLPKTSTLMFEEGRKFRV